MKTHVRRQVVHLSVQNPVEIAPGVILPPGNYSAECKELGVTIMGGHIKWNAPEYHAEFTAEDLKAMGMTAAGSLISIEMPLTQFVRSGQIKVT